MTARQALADFSRTLELQPNHARSYFSIGGIYAVRGDYEIAQYYYQQAAQLGYEAAQLALHKLQQAGPIQHQPTPVDQWQSDSLDLLGQALSMAGNSAQKSVVGAFDQIDYRNNSPMACRIANCQ